MVPFEDMLRDQCENVFEQLGTHVKEVHYQRALNINLQALGYTTDTEKCCSTMFRDVRGYWHTISSDRIDIFVHALDGAYILELKQADTLRPEYAQQARRYQHALERSGHVIGGSFVILFPKTDGKQPSVHHVDA